MPTQLPSQQPSMLETLAELNGQETIRMLHVDDEPDLAEVAGIYMEREEDALDVEAVTSASDEGSGFGLASVRQVAVSHGWQIDATMGDDGGARFEVTDVRMGDDSAAGSDA